MLTKETVFQVAKLARLTISEEDAVVYQEQFEKILNYFQNISTMDTQGVEPLISPITTPAFLREDKVIQDISVDEILKNAPEAKGNLFKVPPVI